MLAVVPARGGSKGIPRKNIAPFLGKPLISWTIEAALESGAAGRLIVSTDDPEIAAVARSLGAEVPFIRPAELAQDATPTAPVVRHALDWVIADGFRPDFVMVLEPTSPARRAFHIREAAQLLRTSGADSVASVSRVPHHYVPSKVLTVNGDGTLTGVSGQPIGSMVHRRQDLPAAYAMNGLIFSCRAECLLADPPSLWGARVQAYVVDSKYAIDLDDPDDWPVAELRVRRILEGGP
ncbi:MAG: acylneuraminate cytidylyltransferase family protein [Deltaproteobacteria bacterium]|nr:acylneuraminate cytidylyltransferase family protein [Deltaproteobacteria bacterium]